MNLKLYRQFCNAVLASTALLAVSTAGAYEAGDWVLRAGPACMFVTGESELITALAPDAKVQVHDAYSFGLTGTYMVTSRIGFGLMSAWPFKNNIEATHDLSEQERCPMSGNCRRY